MLNGFYNFKPVLELFKDSFKDSSENIFKDCLASYQTIEQDIELATQACFAYLNKVRFLSPLRNSELGVNNLNNEFYQRWSSQSHKSLLEQLKSYVSKNSHEQYIDVYQSFLNLHQKLNAYQDISPNVNSQDYRNYLNKTNFNCYPLLVTQNLYHIGLVNGDLGITLDYANTQIAIFKKGNEYSKVQLAHIQESEKAFFTTVHKAQGAEFEETHIVLPLELTAFISTAMYYTAATRVKRCLYIYGPQELLHTSEFASDYRESTLSFA